MGFDVNYSYYKSAGNGEYNKAEKLTANIKVGSPHEDVPVNVLAGKLMALLARRNIFVFDVEIYEIVKKPVSFKEAEDGIIIKNKKFKFDDDTSIVAGEEVPEAITPTAAPPKTIQPAAGQKGGNIAAPLRYEFFLPDDDIWVQFMRKRIPNFNFTPNKKYPVYSEEMLPTGKDVALWYQTMDDKGNKQSVISKIFNPVMGGAAKLEHADEMGMNKAYGDDGGKLRWDGLVSGREELDIRRVK